LIDRVWNLVVKELIQLRRDWLLSAFLLILPMSQMFLLAGSAGGSLEELAMVALDLDRSTQSRHLVSVLDATGELALSRYVDRIEEIDALLDDGDAALAVVIPRDFGERLSDPQRVAHVQVIADGANSLVGLTAKSAADGAILEAARQMLPGGDGPPQGLLELRTTVLFNPTLDHQHYALPAQIGFIVYQISLAVASIAFTRERELGTLEQLLVTPIRRAELVMGKAAPSLFIGLTNFLILLAIVVLGFRVPLRGSFLFLFGLTVAFVLAEIGWGIMISSVSRTQQQALLFVFMLALLDMTLSGYLVSPSNMPRFLQALSLFSPLRHYLALIRSVMLKGAALPALWPHVAALVALAGASLSLGALTIARRLD